jgi:hypothetical protein
MEEIVTLAKAIIQLDTRMEFKMDSELRGKLEKIANKKEDFLPENVKRDKVL